MNTKGIIPIIYICILLLAVCSSCSLTQNLPEGEILYTGQQITVGKKLHTRTEELALSEVEVALDKTPSTKIMGGFVTFPFKVWAYNSLLHDESALGKWLFKRLAANPPVFITAVNPELRTKIASNILRDYGYFNNKVGYQIKPNKKDSLQASISYQIELQNPYFIDSIFYYRFPDDVLSIIEEKRNNSLLKPGHQFNVIQLDEERNRISELLRNKGYFYFRPDYLTYQADTTLRPGGHISLRITPVQGLPKEVHKPYYLGGMQVRLLGKNGEQPTDSIRYKDLDIAYTHKLPVRPKMLYRWLNYQRYVRSKRLREAHQTRLYNQHRQQQIQEKIAQLGIFNYMDIQYLPKDTLLTNDTLDVHILATMAKPWDVELDMNVTNKSNNQVGPGMIIGLTRHNIFGGGERWNLQLKGSYEWQTGSGKKTSLMNSWELGTTTSLTFPRILFPYLSKREFNYPASTSFRLYIDQLNRAKYYELLSFGGNITYDFQPSNKVKHSFSPLQLSYNMLQRRYVDFDRLMEANPTLLVSFLDQFIPSMEYTYTYDNSKASKRYHHLWFQAGVKSAGNITSLVYKIGGKPFGEQKKKFLGAPFSQFVKMNTELRCLWNVDQNNRIAYHAYLGAIFPYGNSFIPPYAEQYYTGGANSIRAFAARSIGPGGYKPEEWAFSYLSQIGTFRLEANVEYRFRIFKDFWGATFLDAGNVWMLRTMEFLPDSKLTSDTFLKQIALGTGLGMRYDMGILVFRLDAGIPLHIPYDTGKKGYYNIKGGFYKNLALHFAIGYPF